MTLVLAWLPRAAPLAVSAAYAAGEAARALARRLLAREALGELAGVAGDALLLVIGEALPWVDGIVYLGRDPDAPRLLLPTALAPTIAPAVLDALVPGAGPAAVVPGRIVPCGEARAIDRDRLAAWVARA